MTRIRSRKISFIPYEELKIKNTLAFISFYKLFESIKIFYYDDNKRYYIFLDKINSDFLEEFGYNLFPTIIKNDVNVILRYLKKLEIEETVNWRYFSKNEKDFLLNKVVKASDELEKEFQKGMESFAEKVYNSITDSSYDATKSSTYGRLIKY